MIEKNRLIRDERSKAILNTDLEALNKYKKEREQARKFELLSKEVKEVKETLNRILTIIEKNS
jgi:tRNA U34 5-carboxymethylaminomethyl modifying GTPase MnmE/TrmE